MAQAAYDSMQFLQKTMLEEVNYLKSNQTKDRIQNCETEDEVKDEIDNIFDSNCKRMVEANQTAKENIKNNLPKKQEEIALFVKEVMPKISASLEQSTAFWKKMFTSVGNFFAGIFKAIAWPFKKVGEFVGWLGGKVKGIFDWIGSLF